MNLHQRLSGFMLEQRSVLAWEDATYDLQCQYLFSVSYYMQYFSGVSILQWSIVSKNRYSVSTWARSPPANAARARQKYLRMLEQFC